jgi:hypothetical protein
LPSGWMIMPPATSLLVPEPIGVRTMPAGTP